MRAKSSCDKTLRYFLLRYVTSSNYCNWIELMCFHSSLISLLYLFYGEWNLISFLLPSYASCVSCPLWLPTLPSDACVWIRVYLEPLRLEITKKDFVISPEILRTDGAFSLFLAFFTLEETSASTFLAFFFIFCLITCVFLKLLLCQEVSGFPVIYLLFLRRFQTHSTGLLVAI